MKPKNLIAVAVAGACAWPLFASAGGATQSTIVGHWEVVTPSSVDESAQHLTGRLSHLGGPTPQAYMIPVTAEVITPSSVDESAPWLAADNRRHRGSHGRVASLPNPQTPSSPNESGVHYAEGMKFHADQVAAVEAARIAAAASYTETLAASEASAEIDRLLLGGSDQPGEPGERETVASVTPGLVDSRMTGMSRTLDVQGEPLPADNMPLQTGELTTGITVDTGNPGAERQQGATVQ